MDVNLTAPNNTAVRNTADINVRNNESRQEVRSVASVDQVLTSPIPFAEIQRVAEESITTETLDRAVVEANRHLANMNRRLSYSVHEDSNVILVRVYDQETDELVRELPPESRLDAMARLQQVLGINVDDSV